MIIVCVGDSFTDGAELWEEKNVPNYTTFKKTAAKRLSVKYIEGSFAKLVEYKELYSTMLEKAIISNQFNQDFVDKMIQLKIKMNALSDNDIIEQRHALAYPAKIAKILKCKTINLGISGGSGLGIITNAIKEMKKICDQNKDEKIVCFFQHTSSGRIWINIDGKNMDFMVRIIDEYETLSSLDAYKIKNIYMKYVTPELMDSEYFMQTLVLQKFCLDNNINFLHFQAINFHDDLLFDEFTKSPKFINAVMCDKLMHYYNQDTNFILPNGHFNCESQPLIANWLVEEMQKRDMI